MKENKRLIELLERLVAFPTVTGNALAAYDCLRYVEEIVSALNMVVRRFHSGGFESLVATSRATMAPKLFLQAHLDVVPADETMFALRRDDGRLVGRGVFDMKYAAACYLLLAEDLRNELPGLDFGIMFTTDEEGSGLNGSKYLLDEGYACDICVLPDGGDNWKIESSAKGGWAFRVRAHGKTAHGSRPWEGENAIDKLLTFIKDTRKLVPMNDHSGTTMVVSQISGGQTHNQVPSGAFAALDIRFVERTTGLKIHNRLIKLAQEQNVNLESITEIDPVVLNTRLPAVQEWRRIAEGIRGAGSTGFTESFGASDARFFAAKNIPVLLTRPDGGGHHGENEWIDETGLYDFYECLTQYVRSMTAPSASVATKQEKRYTAGKLPETVTDPL